MLRSMSFSMELRLEMDRSIFELGVRSGELDREEPGESWGLDGRDHRGGSFRRLTTTILTASC